MANPSYIATAIRRATSVDKSQHSHHQALIAMIIAIAAMDDDEALATLTLYTQNRVTKSPDSLCTKATFHWLDIHFGVRVADDGTAKRGRTWQGKGFTEETKKAAQAAPWYHQVRDLAFKIPTALNLNSLGAQAVKRAHMGEAMPTAEELYADFMSAVADARKNAKVAEWCADYDAKVAAGEIKADEPEGFTANVLAMAS